MAMWTYGSYGKYLPVKGRAFMGLLFFILGITKVTGFAGFAGYVGSLGLPMPEVVAGLVVLIEIVGGAMLILGFHARIAAWVLALFVFATILVAHRNIGDPMQLTQALKNLAIVGGLIYVVKYGSGAWSLSKGSACGCCGTDECVCRDESPSGSAPSSVTM